MHESECTRTQECPRNELGWFRASLTTPVLAAVNTAHGARLRGGAASSPGGGSPQPHVCWACGVGAGDVPELQRLRLNGVFRTPTSLLPCTGCSSGPGNSGRIPSALRLFLWRGLPLTGRRSRVFHSAWTGCLGGEALGSPPLPLPSGEFTPWV